MYGICTYIYHKNQPNVGKYSIGPTMKFRGGGCTMEDTKNNPPGWQWQQGVPPEPGVLAHF